MSLSLTNLPNELLEQILDHAHLPPATLFHLSTQCTRLHIVSLLGCLKACGILHPEDDCSFTIHPTLSAVYADSLLPLRALEILIPKAITKIRRLDIAFPIVYAREVAVLDTYLDRFQELVSRLDSVEEVALRLTAADLVSFLYTLVERDAITWFHQWFRSLVHLLDTIIDCGCTSLTMENLQDIFIVRGIVGDSVPRARQVKIREKTLELFEGRKTKLGEAGRVHMPSRPGLVKLCIIRSAGLHIPPLDMWLHDLLSRSPMASLSFIDTAVSLPSALRCGSTTQVPASNKLLRRLQLVGIGAPSAEELANLFRETPSLEFLEIQAYDGVSTRPRMQSIQPVPLPSSFFPKCHRLAEVRIKGQQLLELFTLCIDDNVMPALERLVVVVGRGFAGWSTTMDVHRGHLKPTVLHILSDRKSELMPFEVWLDVEPRYDIVQWMAATAANGSNSNLRRKWTMCVAGVILGSREKLDLGDYGRLRPGVENWLKQFPRLKNLVLTAVVDDDEALQSMEELARRARTEIYRCVEHLEVNGLLPERGEHN